LNLTHARAQLLSNTDGQVTVSQEKTFFFYAAAGALGGFAAAGLSGANPRYRWVYGRDILFGADRRV